MGRLIPVLRTRRGILCRDDETLTLDDVCDAFTCDAADRELASSRAGAIRALVANPAMLGTVKEYARAHGFMTTEPRELLTVFVRKLTSYPVCPMCGAHVHFNRQLCEYSKYCSAKCQNNAPEVKSRHAATNIRIYGTDNAAKSEKVKAKQIATTVARYGASCYLATDDGKRKAEDTCMRKYGVRHSGMIPESNVKRHETMLSRYGVSHALQAQDFKRKFVSTCQERYGSAYPNIWKLHEIHAKTRCTVYDSLGELFPTYEIQCSRESFLGLHEHDNLWKCKACGKTFTHRGVPFCPCQRKYGMQHELYELVSGICPDAILEDRKTLPSGREIDVYVPSRRIGFEFDGLYWHSEIYHDKKYHLEKTESAASVGVRLIHVFEDEWSLRNEIVRSKITALLGHTGTAINARDCLVSEIGRAQSDAFLMRNHIQGPAIAASHHFGLLHDDKLVAVCTFGKIGGKHNSWYLERYATASGFSVRGGCGKLIKAFFRKTSPDVIRTFADRRWSIGGMYEKIGFTLTDTVRPAYWYVNPREAPIHRIHRFNLRRDNLIAKLGITDAGESETELAARCGYVRIWDCGQLAYEIRRT